MGTAAPALLHDPTRPSTNRTVDVKIVSAPKVQDSQPGDKLVHDNPRSSLENDPCVVLEREKERMRK